MNITYKIQRQTLYLSTGHQIPGRTFRNDSARHGGCTCKSDLDHDTRGSVYALLVPTSSFKISSPPQQDTACFPQGLPVCSTLLLRHTNSSTPPASSLRVLSPNSQAPIVPQTSMRTDLLQALQVLAQLAVHTVCQYLRVLAIHNVTLAIEEPRRYLVLSRILNDGDDAFEFFGGDLTSSKMAIHN